MTQRTYKGEVAPDWAEYVVFGPSSGGLYWANDNRRESVFSKCIGDRHVREGWRREELDPLPTEVWLVVCPELPARRHEHPSEAEAEQEARALASRYVGRTFVVARITQKITKPVQPELIVEKL